MPIRPSTEAANLLEAVWQPTMKKQTNEAGRIFPTFDKPEGVSRIGNLLHISKILRQPTTTLAASGTGTSLTYTNNTEQDVTCAPTFTYGAVEIAQHTMSRLLRFPALQKAYREQIISGLVAEKDARAGLMANSLTVTKGGIGQNFDKAFLLDGIGTLGENCREMWEPGSGKWAFLTFHPRQYKHVMNISEITNAQIRGDAEKPVKVGWVWEAFGLAMSLSGNVYTSGGIAHNFLHIKESHVYGLNDDFHFKDPQEFELVTRLIAWGECGFAEVWDEYAVDMQTAA